MTDFFSSTIVLSFPPPESKLLGGKCLTYIGTEGMVTGLKDGFMRSVATFRRTARS